LLLSAASGASCGRPSRSAGFLALLESELAVPDPLAIGRAVAAASPAGLDPSVLWRDLMEGLPLTDAAAFSTAWRARCSSDFENDDRLVVDGWRLSRTEGIACAALALEEGARRGLTP
jgi:hypothetical protein